MASILHHLPGRKKAQKRPNAVAMLPTTSNRAYLFLTFLPPTESVGPSPSPPFSSQRPVYAGLDVLARPLLAATTTEDAICIADIFGIS
jgi:hypothetical protein